MSSLVNVVYLHSRMGSLNGLAGWEEWNGL